MEGKTLVDKIEERLREQAILDYDNKRSKVMALVKSIFKCREFNAWEGSEQLYFEINAILIKYGAEFGNTCAYKILEEQFYSELLDTKQLLSTLLTQENKNENNTPK